MKNVLFIVIGVIALISMNSYADEFRSLGNIKICGQLHIEKYRDGTKGYNVSNITNFSNDTYYGVNEIFIDFGNSEIEKQIMKKKFKEGDKICVTGEVVDLSDDMSLEFNTRKKVSISKGSI